MSSVVLPALSILHAAPVGYCWLLGRILLSATWAKFVRSAVATLAAATLVASCGGGDSSGSSAGQGVPSGSDSLTNASEGTVTVSGHSATFDQGVLVAPTTIKASVASDPDLNADFSGDAWLLGPDTIVAADELTILLSANNLKPDSTVKVTLSVPGSLVPPPDGSMKLQMMYLQQYQSDDEEHEEALTTWAPAEGAYDVANKTVLAKLPPQAFQLSEADHSVAATVKLALVNNFNWGLESSEKTAKATCTTTIPTEAQDAAQKLSNPLGSEQLKIVGPYSEPDGHKGAHHSGIDFTIREGVVVRATRAGYIERIALGSCKAGKPCPADNAGDVRIFYVVVRHRDGSGSRYLHLKTFSAQTKNGLIILPGKNLQQTQTLWVERNPMCPNYPVSAGDAIGLSGKTGTSGPHLHFEYGSGQNGGLLGRTMNPILSLSEVGIEPKEVQLSASHISEVPKIRLKDYTSGKDILVRRKKPGVFLPVAARGDNFEIALPANADGKTSRSNWPVVKVDWTFGDDSNVGRLVAGGSKQFTNYTSPVSGLNTDNGQFMVALAGVPSTSGSTSARMLIESVEDASSAGTSVPTITRTDANQLLTVPVVVTGLPPPSPTPGAASGSGSGSFSASVVDRKTCKTVTQTGGENGGTYDVNTCVFTSYAVVSCAGCGDDPATKHRNFTVREAAVKGTSTAEGCTDTGTQTTETPWLPFDVTSSNSVLNFDSESGSYTIQGGTASHYRMSGDLPKVHCVAVYGTISYKLLATDNRTGQSQEFEVTINQSM